MEMGDGRVVQMRGEDGGVKDQMNSFPECSATVMLVFPSQLTNSYCWSNSDRTMSCSLDDPQQF